MNRKAQVVMASFVWIMVLLVGAMCWKFFIVPAHESAQKELVKQEHEKTVQKTSANSRYNTQINFAYDSFSGYCVFRSQEFENELGHKRIKMNAIDDGADYTARLKGLKSGNTQIAVFTIDALIKASAEMGDIPATAVAIVDETRGADAMVAYKEGIPNIDALNDVNTKFVLTPNSPSETLARVVMSHFGLRNLSKDVFSPMADAEAVYKDYRQSKPTDKKVFILWEPYVTKVIENPNMHVLVDSSRFKGYIVDVIVVNRDFLLKNENVVQDFVESYLRALYAQNMTKSVAEDAVKAGQPLSEKQIERLVTGIWWKNTNENFAHFGLNSDRPLQHIEDMIKNISDVLISTDAIKSDPTKGQPNLLYYDKILARLQTNNFHPGLNEEKIRKDTDNLPELTEEEWNKLIPVGTLEVPQLVFARGTDRITEQTQITLDELISKLKTWQQYYLIIRGNASLQGDLEANKALATARAKAVEKYLFENGIGKTRVKAVGVEPSGQTSVVFQLGYTNY